MKKRVLIVDDKNDTAQAIGDALELTDRYKVEVLTHGLQLMKRVREDASAPDLLILDIFIDDTDRTNGEEVAHEIRHGRESLWKSVKILLVSGKIPPDEIAEKSRPAEGLFYATKSVDIYNPELGDPRAIVGRVDEILGR